MNSRPTSTSHTTAVHPIADITSLFLDNSLSTQSQLADRGDMAIEGLAADAEFIAQVGDDRTFLSKSVLSQPQFRWRHLGLATSVATTGTGGDWLPGWRVS
jgi:hypothetical protein